MKCGYCGNKHHTITDCPIDNDLVNLLYSSDEINFNLMSYKVLRKIASRTCYQTTLPKCELIKIFTRIKNKYIKKEESCECAICYETLGNTNVCTTPCGHKFCMTCIVKMVKNGSSSSNSCPLCRKQLIEQQPPTTPLNNNFINFIQSTIYYPTDEPISPILSRELFVNNEPTSVTVNSESIINNNDNINIIDNVDNVDDINIIDNNIDNNNYDIDNNNYFEGIESNIIYNNNDYLSELDVINLLSNNMETIENRRETRNQEEYNVRQQHINELHIVERG